MKYRGLTLFILVAGSVIFHSCQPADKSTEVGDNTLVDHTVVDTTKIAGINMTNPLTYGVLSIFFTK